MPRSFRIVCQPEQVSLVEDLLRSQGYTFSPEPFSALAYQVHKQPRPLGSSIAAAFGLIYIQDRSSMLPPLLLAPPAGAMVLDMCSSPGSKTGLLAQLVGRKGLVLANEPNEQRLATLRHNLAALNLAHVTTCRYPGQDLPLPEGMFSHILLDPPCSGWGTVERNPRILEMWPPHKLKPLISLQRELLRKASLLLAPGGRLLYSTCTTNPQENQDQIQWALAELDLNPAPLHFLPGFDDSSTKSDLAGGCMQVRTEAGEGQGFFLSALIREKGDDPPDMLSDRDDLPGKPLDMNRYADTEDIAWANLPSGEVRDFKGRIMFLPQRTTGFPHALRWQGFELGRFQGGALRLNTRLRMLLPEYSPERGINIDDVDDLVRLLQGQSLHLSAGQIPSRKKSGPFGLYWRGLPLGWATVKGNRCLWSPR
ncbi:RsmB/NOP family class I SAM-dependent RNA methyltransferase [Desulfonatronum parangueonense]